MSGEPAPSPPRAHWIIWLFAAVGLLGILGILALLAMALNVGRPYHPPEVAGVKAETVFTLANVTELRGTNLIEIDIDASDGRGGSSAYSGGRPDTRNILLLDKATGDSRKLLPDNSRHILQSRFLPAKAGLVSSGDDALMGVEEAERSRDEPPPAYYVLTVAQGDSDGAQDILVGTLAGGRQDYVMRGIDGVDSVWMQSATRLGLIVREDRGLYYRIVDIPSLNVVQSKRVAID